MSDEPKQRRQVSTPAAERVGHVATGALVGAVIAGPVGAVAGAAVGAMLEKGVPEGRRSPEKGAEAPMENTVSVTKPSPGKATD